MLDRLSLPHQGHHMAALIAETVAVPVDPLEHLAAGLFRYLRGPPPQDVLSSPVPEQDPPLRPDGEGAVARCSERLLQGRRLWRLRPSWRHPRATYSHRAPSRGERLCSTIFASRVPWRGLGGRASFQRVTARSVHERGGDRGGR